MKTPINALSHSTHMKVVSLGNALLSVVLFNLQQNSQLMKPAIASQAQITYFVLS